MKPEDQLHKACAQFLDLKKLVWFSVPNGAHMSPATCRNLKNKGQLQPGVPDIVVLWDEPATAGDEIDFSISGTARCYPGIGFIELKAGRNKLSDAQKDWCIKVVEKGAYFGIVRSVDELQDTLRQWGAI